jgi:hypothetical protein
MELRKALSGVGASLLTDQQERYFRLMRQGMNNVQACRAVGVGRKTGTRWRLGRTETRKGRRQIYLPIYLSAHRRFNPFRHDEGYSRESESGQIWMSGQGI